MSARPLPMLASVDEIVGILDAINNRTSLLGFLGPLRMPEGLDEHDRARVTAALIAASARCWAGRFPA